VKLRTVGEWGYLTLGKHYAPPKFAGALDAFGAALEAATGDTGSTQIELDVYNLRALGSALRRIAAGEDARHVFAQTRPGHRASERLRNSTVAGVYWQTLAEGLAADLSDLEAKSAATARAQAHFDGERITAARVERVARTYRDVWMRVFETQHAKAERAWRRCAST
jgi:hypothetical protein